MVQSKHWPDYSLRALWERFNWLLLDLISAAQEPQNQTVHFSSPFVSKPQVAPCRFCLTVRRLAGARSYNQGVREINMRTHYETSSWFSVLLWPQTAERPDQNVESGEREVVKAVVAKLNHNNQGLAVKAQSTLRVALCKNDVQ